VKSIARLIHTLSKGGLEMDGKDIFKLSFSHLLSSAVHLFENRWVEVTTGADFIVSFRIMNHVSSKTREKLEDRAVEFVQDFEILEMIRVSSMLYFNSVLEKRYILWCLSV